MSTTDDNFTRIMDGLNEVLRHAEGAPVTLQSGGIRGPGGEVSHYTMERRDGGEVVMRIDGGKPMLATDLRHHLSAPYDIAEPCGGWKRDFTADEKALLRPVAETLAMLDGNAFFGIDLGDGRDWYEQYLPEAHELWVSNGRPPLGAQERE